MGPTTRTGPTAAVGRIVGLLTLAAVVGILAVGAVAASAMASPIPAAQAETSPVVLFTPVTGPITPVTADHLRDALAEAEATGVQALVVELDTPGGLVTSMRDIVQGFLNTSVPVVVHVTPSGADAGSAGTFITLASHVAAMSPATTIGAATPVDLQGGEVGDKIVNNAAAYAEAVAEARGRNVDFAIDSVRDGRSITAATALDTDVVDLIAVDRADLMAQLDGRTVELPDDRVVTLSTADAVVRELPLSWTRSILARLADPNVAFLLLSLATLAILYEIANPGVGAGGVVGAVSLVLGLYALSVLPVNFAGIALLVVSGVLFTVEVFAPGVGIGAAGGTVTLFLAGLFLFQRPTGIGVDLRVLVPTAIVVSLAMVGIGIAAARTRGVREHGPSDDLVGRTAALRDAAGDRPRVRLDGTWWTVEPAADAVPLDQLGDDAEVVVVSRDNLVLRVAPAPTHERT